MLINFTLSKITDILYSIHFNIFNHLHNDINYDKFSI
jgi:hypothetical protein